MPSIIASSTKAAPRQPDPDEPPDSGGLQPGHSEEGTVWWEKDLTGRYVRASENFCQFFGLAGVLSPIGLVDRDLFQENLSRIYKEGDQNVIQSRQPSIVEEIYTGGWLETVKTPVFDSEGILTGVYGLARNIGERHRLALELQKRERDYRSLAEHSPDIILRFDLHGRLAYANPQAFQFGNRRPEEVYGLPPEDHAVLPAHEAHRFSESIAQVLETGHPTEIEFNWMTAEGERHVHLRLVPEFGFLEEVSGVLVFGRDLSKLYDARTRLRRSHELLRNLAIRRQQEHEESRRDITHRIHEDLAQELSALRMHLKLLARELPEAGNPLLEVMDEITVRCIARIRDMVKTIRPSALDLGIVPALRWLADDFYRGLELEFELQLPESLEADDKTATFLFRSAQEALLNVALHAAATRVEIQLTSQRGRLRLRIQDNGCGFHPHHPLPDRSIGLLGIAEQARHLGGKLLVRSAPGDGTLLEIIVPFQPRQKNLL